jgi:hypothetical protein
MNGMALSEIWIYPVKSLAGIRLQSANIFPKGLENDRRFMLVDEDGKFITQRVLPTLSRFRVSIDQNLNINFDQEHIHIPLNPPVRGAGKAVQIWNDTVTAHEVDPLTSAWFSEHLKQKCQLVFFPEVNSRPVDARYQVNHEQVSLADAYPFLIIGQSSLNDLNTRLQDPVNINRFRPNFVFTGGLPYEEDSWRNFTIGSNRFVGVKPCDRCVMTTIDPETGEKGKEPLKTLATYRSRDNKIYFGQNLVAVDHTTVSVGDRITIHSQTN